MKNTEKTFDELLLEVWERFNMADKAEEITLAIKVAITKRIGVVDLVDQIATYTEDYVLEGGTELTVTEDFTDNIGELLVGAFNITPEVGEVIDREFDFDEWVENAEGPPSPNQIELMGRENTEECAS
jgi:hypothetical protein